MSSAKTTIRRIVKDLPENCTLEDVQYQLYLAQKVQRGLQSIREGRGIPHTQAKQRLSKWLSK